jgi:hypothetical protein
LSPHVRGPAGAADATGTVAGAAVAAGVDAGGVAGGGAAIGGGVGFATAVAVGVDSVSGEAGPSRGSQATSANSTSGSSLFIALA